MSAKRREIKENGGDIVFVSVSPTKEKLAKFLELNSEVPRDRIFVDNTKTFEAYKAVGFGNLTDVDKSTKPEMKPPGFGFGEWAKYLMNVIALSPIDPNEKLTGPPEGVLRLGGTFVLKKNDIVYAWADALPGAHPEPNDVVSAAKLAWGSTETA
jgi:hypothetical protein